MSWDCNMHPTVISENEAEKFYLYLYSEYRLNPKSWGTSVHLFWRPLTLLYAVDIDLCLPIYKWYTDINPGGLFRNLYLTHNSHSVPPSYSESVKRKERKKIFILSLLCGYRISAETFKQLSEFFLPEKSYRKQKLK